MQSQAENYRAKAREFARTRRRHKIVSGCSAPPKVLTCTGRSHWTTNRSASSVDKLSYELRTLLSARRTPYHPWCRQRRELAEGTFEPASHSTASGATKIFCRRWTDGVPAWSPSCSNAPSAKSAASAA